VGNRAVVNLKEDIITHSNLSVVFHTTGSTFSFVPVDTLESRNADKKRVVGICLATRLNLFHPLLAGKYLTAA
jgi:hypothetical protein